LKQIRLSRIRVGLLRGHQMQPVYWLRTYGVHGCDGQVYFVLCDSLDVVNQRFEGALSLSSLCSFKKEVPSC
jgi:hypothetical protein